LKCSLQKSRLLSGSGRQRPAKPLEMIGSLYRCAESVYDRGVAVMVDVRIQSSDYDCAKHILYLVAQRDYEELSTYVYPMVDAMRESGVEVGVVAASMVRLSQYETVQASFCRIPEVVSFQQPTVKHSRSRDLSTKEVLSVLDTEKGAVSLRFLLYQLESPARLYGTHDPVWWLECDSVRIGGLPDEVADKDEESKDEEDR
jgi:hypothetical protein